jgi:hypothetical protein
MNREQNWGDPARERYTLACSSGFPTFLQTIDLTVNMHNSTLLHQTQAPHEITVNQMGTRSSSCSCPFQTAVRWNNIGVACLQESKYQQAASSFNSALVQMSKCLTLEPAKRDHVSCQCCQSAAIVPSGMRMNSFIRRPRRSHRNEFRDAQMEEEEAHTIFKQAFFIEAKQRDNDRTNVQPCRLEPFVGAILFNVAISYHLMSLSTDASTRMREKNRHVSQSLYNATINVLLSFGSDEEGQLLLIHDRNYVSYRFAVMAALNNALHLTESTSQDERLQWIEILLEYSSSSPIALVKFQGQDIDEPTIAACREWEGIFSSNAQLLHLKSLGILYDSFAASAA